MVEMLAPTETEAKPSAVQPVQEHIPEDEFQEISIPSEETTQEEKVVVEFTQSTKQAPQASLVSVQLEELQPEDTRDMSPTHDQESQTFVEKQVIFARSMQTEKEQSLVQTIVEEVNREITMDIAVKEEFVQSQQEEIIVETLGDIKAPQDEIPKEEEIKVTEEACKAKDHAVLVVVPMNCLLYLHDSFRLEGSFVYF